MTCPYGHDDLSDYGYCLAEVHTSYARLCALWTDRLRHGDVSGAEYAYRHAGTWLRRMSPQEQYDRLCNRFVTIP